MCQTPELIAGPLLSKRTRYQPSYWPSGVYSTCTVNVLNNTNKKENPKSSFLSHQRGVTHFTKVGKELLPSQKYCTFENVHEDIIFALIHLLHLEFKACANIKGINFKIAISVYRTFSRKSRTCENKQFGK